MPLYVLLKLVVVPRSYQVYDIGGLFLAGDGWVACYVAGPTFFAIPVPVVFCSLGAVFLSEVANVVTVFRTLRD